jgi:beta-xylosidase
MEITLSQPKDLAGTHAALLEYAYPWQSDQGDGTYLNPIIYADYSDPDVVRVGDDFYLTASSFNCTPGLPILHSKDLVNWTIVGHAVKNLPHPRYAAVQPGCGIWAPAIRFHAGKFWIFFPMPDEGIYVTQANAPAGEWSEPHQVQEGKGLIDPCPLWDDDGKAYLVHAYARSRSGIKHVLRVRPMAPDGSKLLGEGQIIYYNPERHPTLEGPKFLKKDGWYYVLAPAGGVETGWQVALRSRNICGPYEDRIVLARGDTHINGPHQGALVDTPDNRWWFVHFQDADVYGRITHLQPVEWKEGWPLMGRRGEPVLRHEKPRIVPAQEICTPQASDEFDGDTLGPQWQWQANHSQNWYSLAMRRGWLRLFSQPRQPALKLQPNLLLQKFPARSFSAETILEIHPKECDGESGLVVMGESHMALGLLHERTKNYIVVRANDDLTWLGEIMSHQVKLRVEVRSGGQCSFGFSNNGDWGTIPQTFQARKGTWVGAKLGLYSVQGDTKVPAGHADFDYLRFQ